MEREELKIKINKLESELDILEARRIKLNYTIHDKKSELNRLLELLEIKGNII